MDVPDYTWGKATLPPEHGQARYLRGSQQPTNPPFYKLWFFQTQNLQVKVGFQHLNPLIRDSSYSTYPLTTKPEEPSSVRLGFCMGVIPLGLRLVVVILENSSFILDVDT